MSNIEPLEPRRLLSGTFKVLTFFDAYRAMGTLLEGNSSVAGVVVDGSGNIFGTTDRQPDSPLFVRPAAAGEVFYTDTVFELPKGNVVTKDLHDFPGQKQDAFPNSLIMDAAGDLFGTTVGGLTTHGTVYEMVKSGGTYTYKLLHTFTGGADGNYPECRLAVDSSGNLYGTAFEGGAFNNANSGGDGVIFELPKSGNAFGFKVLCSFRNGSAGRNPASGVILDSSGNLYGTTTFGGTFNQGAIFELPKGASTVKTLASFNGANGSQCQGELAMDASGNLFGTTNAGGAFNVNNGGDGTIFELSKGSSTIKVLHSFANGSDGENPFGWLVIDRNGNLYGTASNRSDISPGTATTTGTGTVYGLAKTASGYSFKTLYSFSNVDSNAVNNDGGEPMAGLFLDSAGNLFGTTSLGGKGGGGTIFEMSGFVAAPAATKLAFVKEPASIVAGQASSPAFTVNVEDASGHLVTSNTSTVTLSIVSGPTGGKLSGTFSVKAAGGVATFAGVRLTKAGTYVLKANDGTLASATSASFKVIAGKAARLAFLHQPPAGKVGKALSPAITVAVEDNYGNVVATDHSTVKISIDAGPAGAVLGGTLSVADVLGIATFSNVRLSKAGTYRLKATDQAYAPSISSQFKIS